MSGRDRYTKNDFENDVRKISNLDSKLREKGVEKIIIPSNIIDTYTRLENLKYLVILILSQKHQT